jgi:hypothetical protein
MLSCHVVALLLSGAAASNTISVHSYHTYDHAQAQVTQAPFYLPFPDSTSWLYQVGVAAVASSRQEQPHHGGHFLRNVNVFAMSSAGDVYCHQLTYRHDLGQDFEIQLEYVRRGQERTTGVDGRV